MNNSNIDHNGISREVIKASIASIEEQGWLPKSPCAELGFETALCAGAWVVYWTLWLQKGEEAAKGFVDRLKTSKESGEIVITAKKIGLPVSIVKSIVLNNDSTEKEKRIRTSVEFLKNIQHLA